ncbi:MAG: putative DNA modification/repair radical SAM protein [Eggerthellaceae bacterium]|nr:putative DNA modification/repair radical SAM protein [Eggerthellaceae bacterium]
MDCAEKLEILADAAKYDVACTSSGVSRSAQKGKLGNTVSSGCCHSFTPDGRCISLLKVLLTNACIYDCAYCVNRSSNDTRRVAFTPRELADLTVAFYRRNYIEGLFLSSGVLKSPDFTTQLMIETLSLLRHDYGFRGYIHAKVIPGTSPELVDELGHLADRMSVNMELPSQASLDYLAPDKSGHSVIAPMKQICSSIAQDRDTRSLTRHSNATIATFHPDTKKRAFVPAGQSTQIIVGATQETDYQLLNLSASLYRALEMKRVFWSAYVPVNNDARLPKSARIQLDREHRLFQADWLLRFYGFEVSEIIDEQHPNLDLLLDPKANWALNHLDRFPLEVNTAPLESLMRVPGIGVVGARKIVAARRTHALGEAELRKLGVAYARARYFVTCSGTWGGGGIAYEPETLRARLANPIKGGAHGRREPRRIEGQLSLEEVDESFGVQAAGNLGQNRKAPRAQESAPLPCSKRRFGSPSEAILQERSSVAGDPLKEWRT